MSERWNAELRRERQEMDTEHTYQVGLLDNLLAALEKGERKGAGGLFEQLLDVSGLHFADEQVLMRQHSYPLYRAHLEEHGRMVETLHELVERHRSGRLLSDEVVAVRGWFSSHITHMDREFETHLLASAKLE